MKPTWTVLVGLALAIGLGGVAGASLQRHGEPQATPGSPQRPRATTLALSHRPRELQLSADSRRQPLTQRVSELSRSAHSTRRTVMRRRVSPPKAVAFVPLPRPIVLDPVTPAYADQVGGREPAERAIANDGWINTPSVNIVVPLASHMSAALLQAQVELVPATRSFSGQPNVFGPVVAVAGVPRTGVVRVRGLRDGVTYHWRVRIHDTRGADSPWAGGEGVGLRVHLAAPPAPALSLAAPTSTGGWLGSRQVTLAWSPPRDGTGIRGYSYTLSRSPLAAPALHWRTGSTQVTITARGDGPWFATVRALSKAHTWSAPARVALRIDTAVPRLQQVAVPAGAVNATVHHTLARVRLTDWSRVLVQVVTASGRVLLTHETPLGAPDSVQTVSWDGRSSGGTLLRNGRYLVRIGAVNRAGIAWQTARPLFVENAPPSFSSFGLSQTGAYNPFNNALDGTEDITAALDTTGTVRIDAAVNGKVLRSWQLVEPRPGAVITATWDGSTRLGARTPEGTYTFTATATDAAGNTSVVNLGSVALDLRRIIVSLDQQQLWALDGNRVLLTDLVTTGGPIMPTPTGDFQIIDRESPFTFRSMYPKGSILWYPPSPVHWALMFQQGGYFLHDAPWRGFFGPGSNAVDGRPGSNTTGTHGCVNVPYYSMAWLFQWASMYTPVQVRQHVVPGRWP